MISVLYKGSEFSFEDLKQIAADERPLYAIESYLTKLLDEINPHFYGQQNYPVYSEPVTISRDNIKISFIS